MMKRMSCLFLCVALVFCLTGCVQQAPTTTNEGADWDADWTLVGTTLGIEEPGNGLTLLDNKDALTASGLYYAAWVIGEAEDYVNADGDTIDLYDAQLYVLLQDCDDETAAQTSVDGWQAQEEEAYNVLSVETATCADQTFTILIYETADEENPYASGVSAFTAYQDHAINVELACQDGFDGDAYAILTEFLEGFHYAE